MPCAYKAGDYTGKLNKMTAEKWSKLKGSNWLILPVRQWKIRREESPSNLKMLWSVPKYVLSKDFNICNEGGHLQNSWYEERKNWVICRSHISGIFDPGVLGSHKDPIRCILSLILSCDPTEPNCFKIHVHFMKHEIFEGFINLLVFFRWS